MVELDWSRAPEVLFQLHITMQSKHSLVTDHPGELNAVAQLMFHLPMQWKQVRNQIYPGNPLPVIEQPETELGQAIQQMSTQCRED